MPMVAKRVVENGEMRVSSWAGSGYSGCCFDEKPDL